MVTAKRKYPVGIQTFSEMIRGGYVYVDKTDLLYTLCNNVDRQLFISRPRRFGKSLMLSTLKAMFEGRRELFKGLAIYDKPWEGWTAPTPVYSFTMSEANGGTFEEVRESLSGLVDGLCERGYADKWKGGPRPVTLVGINFSSRKRNIDFPLVEPL